MPIEGWITLFVVVVAACVFVVLPARARRNILANNTPAGGDMGAHVWGPAYLRDHLLPQGRLTRLDARLVRRVPGVHRST